MAPATAPTHALRTLVFRPRPSAQQRLLQAHNAVVGVKRPASHRWYADSGHDGGKDAQQPAGPNMQQLEHVSEEAAKIAKIQGGEGPDIEGQGTPVQDIMKEEKETRQQAPQVLKESLKSAQAAQGKASSSTARSFSTLARQQADTDLISSATLTPALDPTMLPTTEPAHASTPTQQPPPNPILHPSDQPGHKHPLPPSNLTRHELDKSSRYDTIVTQATNLLMRDGKKATARRMLATILNDLRTGPAPTYSTTRGLLPGAPPASHLPLHPVLYLTLAVDSVAPLLRIRKQRGAAGGGVALDIPVPLARRQRRRQAFVWIIAAAEKRRSHGSGRDMFAHKVAQELVAVVEGRSSVWQRRQEVHRLATTARANLNWGRGRGRR